MSKGMKPGNIAVWAILGLLVVAMGGFGITSFGGSIRDIGSVGRTPISVNDYFGALQQEIRAAEAQTGQRFSLQQAELFGLTDRARSQVVTAAAMDEEARRLGLSVGNDAVDRQILSNPAFVGSDGQFSADTFVYALEQQGISEKEFEEQLRREITRGFLQAGILSGVVAPSAYQDALVNYYGARRGYSLIRLGADDLDDPLFVPTEDDLVGYHAENEAAFTRPETRQITYVWLTPAMLQDDVTVDEDAMRTAYQDRIDEFVQPERRLVERLIFPDQASADAARTRLDGDEASFDQLVEERGLALSDIDLGDVTEQALGPAGADVFAQAEEGVVGPLETPLGPALFRLNGILHAQETTFEQAADFLRAEVALDAARRQIADVTADIDDLLAAGATLEELASDTQLQLGTIGFNENQADDIAGYQAFRQAATTARESDFLEIGELSDGGIFALRLDGIDAPALQPLDTVREAVTQGWRAQETARRLKAQADKIATGLGPGSDLAALGFAVEQADAITRDAITPQALSEVVFGLAAPGDVATAAVDDGAVLVRLDEVLPPDDSDPTMVLMRTALAQQIARDLSQEIFQQVAQSLLDQAGADIDAGAIAAIHAQFTQ